MPLESLSQPFNPDEPGRKLREVQVEPDPEVEKRESELFEHIKDVYYKNGIWHNAPGGLSPISPDEKILRWITLVEQEMYIPVQETTVSPKSWEKVDFESSSNDIAGAVFPFARRNPEMARTVWQEKMKKIEISFVESKGLFSYEEEINQKNEGRDIAVTIDTLFEWLLVEPENAKKAAQIFFEQYPFKKLISLIDWYPFDIDDPPLNYILLEAYCNSDGARAHFEKCKQKDFDKQSGLWSKKYPSLLPQVVGLLIELQLERNENVKLRSSFQAHEIPEERNF